MLAEIRFLHVPSADTNVLPSFMLQVDADRYLFNVGEGTSRALNQRKAGLTRISNIFVPRVGWEAIGGLPGTLMSIADGHRPEEAVHGPAGLRYALATMRYYAKRDTMKLSIHEVDNTGSGSTIYTDHNLAVHAVTLLPTSASRQSKKLKLDGGTPNVDASTLAEVEEMWRTQGFNPHALRVAQAQAWIQIVSDSLFNNSPRRLPEPDKLDVEITPPPADGGYVWKPPSSPAFVNKKLPFPPNRRVHSEDRSDPAEGGQAPVLAFICETHSQRGKFDPVKATEAGVPPGRDFATLTKGEDITLQRPKAWQSMPLSERKAWLQRIRKGKWAKPAVEDSAPAVELEEVVVKSHDVLGPSRTGVVLVQVYLPSIDYIDALVNGEAAAATFAPYTVENNKDRHKQQSRVPQVMVHAAPTKVFEDKRYQAWMQQFGPDCDHILANRDVCANKLMFPSSATIPLRLSKLDNVMFKVPPYELAPRVDPQKIFESAPPGSLQITSAGASLAVSLHPRGKPRQVQSDATDFDWPVNSQQAEDLAAFNTQPSALNGRPLTEDVPKSDGGADEFATKNVRLQEARKEAWAKFLEIVAETKSAPHSTKDTPVQPKDDVLVTTLGTGSASPSKHRNVISTLVQTPNSGNILLDAGEATYGQLRRKFGCRRDGTADAAALKGEDVDEILSNLRVLFISHIHADHHIGLIQLLIERRKLPNRPKQPLYVIGTSFVRAYLREYEQIEQLGTYEDVILVPNEHLNWKVGVDPLDQPGVDSLDQLGVKPLDQPGVDPLDQPGVEPPDQPGVVNPSDSPVPQSRLDAPEQLKSQSRRDSLEHTLKQVKALKALTGLSYVHTAKVIHRGSHCYGLVLRHSEGWSVTYSGDTRPAPELIAAGRDSSLLIHEATLEDSQLEMAINKGHSTFGEAIDVGKQMNAQNILLTHFSQRYPKMAKSSLFAASAAGTPIALAFDMVTYPLSQFSKIQSYTPAMEALFAAEFEGDDEGTDDLAGESASKDAETAAAEPAAKAGAKPDAPQSESGEAMNVDTPAQSESALAATPANAEKEARKPRQTRKAFKPDEWKYLGISISSPAFTSSTPPSGLSVLHVTELVRSAQTSVMGTVGGAFSFDVLALDASTTESKTTWNAVIRTPPTHAADLAAALALLPAPTLPANGTDSGNLRLRLSVVGPATSIQTLQSLFP